MESKYNLLTRLLKNIKNVVNPDGSVAGGVPVVHATNDGNNLILDKTYQEIEDAGFCVMHYANEGRTRVATLSALIDYNNGHYGVNFDNDESVIFTASSRTDYPLYHDGK